MSVDNITFTSAEQIFYARLFKACDVNKTGAISMAHAKHFLIKSNVANESLHRIVLLTLGQDDNVTLERFSLACRGIALSQGGLEINEKNLRGSENQAGIFLES